MDTRVHSSVAEQLTADQQVPGSIPGVPLGVASFSAGDVEPVAWVQSEFDTNRSRRNREDRARGRQRHKRIGSSGCDMGQFELRYNLFLTANAMVPIV